MKLHEKALIEQHKRPNSRWPTGEACPGVSRDMCDGWSGKGKTSNVSAVSGRPLDQKG